MWKKIGSGKYMQNWTGCNKLQEHETITLIDSRDNASYTVAKLKDGKCWMAQDLKLGGNELRNRMLTPEDSDISDNFILPDSSSSGFYYPGQFDTAWVYIDLSYAGSYSWKAATAGTGTGSMSSGDASGSICPKGWRLPTGGSGGEYETMAKKYGLNSSTLTEKPAPGFDMFGGMNGGSVYGRGSYGSYWASTASGSSTAYGLRLRPSSSASIGGEEKSDGWSVRCVAR